MRKSFAVSITLATILAGGTALAGPQPPTQEELMDLADLVVDVKVVDTVCDGDSVDEEWGTSTSYESDLEVLDVVKGQAEDFITYQVSETVYDEGYGQPGCSSPEIVLPAGWVGRLYLQGSSESGYAIEFFGAAEIDPEASVLEQLPDCSVTSTTYPADVEVEGDDTDTAGAQGCSVTGAASSSNLWWCGIPLALVLGARRRRRTGT